MKLFNYFKVAVTAGVISAATSFLLFILFLNADINPLGGAKAFSYFLMFVLFFPPLIYFKRVFGKGELHFHQAFLIGVGINLVACSLYALFINYYLNGNEEILAKHIAESKLFFSSMKEEYIKNTNENAYNENLKSLDHLSIGDVVLDEFYKRFFILIFFVFIAAFIMRRTIPEDKMNNGK